MNNYFYWFLKFWASTVKLYYEAHRFFEDSPSKDIGTKNAANDVSKMRNVVHIRQGTRYQNVLLPRHRKTAVREELNR